MSDVLVEFNNISKFFGSVIALKDVTMKVKKGEIMCLLGDNGAGKSTLIKTLSGVHKPDEGEIIVEGEKTIFDTPKDALDMGIATVYQDLALVSLMSVTRNFFMGREPQKGVPFFKTFDIEKANKILIPCLVAFLVVAMIYPFILNPSGAAMGLRFLFIPQWDYLFRGETWIRALTQSAWSTSAGFGMAITYDVAMIKNADSGLNAFLTGLGNNTFVLIAV